MSGHEPALKSRRPRLLQLAEGARMPNSELPVVIYRNALVGDHREQEFYRLFQTNGWGGCWSAGIYGYHHFHSNAHEVLGIARGSGELLLGGERGELVTVEAGDVIIIPAGTGHRRVKDSWDFWVVGAYPKGQENFDEYLDKKLCANYRARIRAVAMPERDPLYGQGGPLTRTRNKAALWADWRRIVISDFRSMARCGRSRL